MIAINRETYENVIDAIRYHYVFTGKRAEDTPIAVGIGVNKVYLDRLEEFLKDHVDLPGFYAFVEGRGGTFDKEVSYPMCKNTLMFILESLEEKNNHENLPIKKEITLPAGGGNISLDGSRIFAELGHSYCIGDRKQLRAGLSKTKPQ